MLLDFSSFYSNYVFLSSFCVLMFTKASNMTKEHAAAAGATFHRNKTYPVFYQLDILKYNVSLLLCFFWTRNILLIAHKMNSKITRLSVKYPLAASVDDIYFRRVFTPFEFSRTLFSWYCPSKWPTALQRIYHFSENINRINERILFKFIQIFMFFMNNFLFFKKPSSKTYFSSMKSIIKQITWNT